ncbi:thioredoxin-dependent thiol peroxidase [Priestia megaterium]|uniref:thioredoxin-dependent thiol peroxidase n=1 Tax=Priestia megaterium TaxID=1404 RepID=UPI0036DF59B0
MKHIKVGENIPNFTLPSSNGKEVSLHDFKGEKVVIYFYPKNMTPGCTAESCDFRDYNSQFKNLNTEVIGISPDDLKSHEGFITKYELPFLLLSDTEHQIAELFDVWKLRNKDGKEFMGVERATFLIDEEGKLVKEWRKVNVEGHVQEILDTVKNI